ncbi:MAG: hypothetical protein P4K98_07380 [Bryobacteraceae bacterium]|nr:hypothetical protein [Bryobacteraceae bacterium]
MPENTESRVPAFLRWLVLFASWIVPARRRAGWRSGWESELKGWWALVQRGDLTEYSSREIVRTLRRACAEAFWSRIDREHLRRILNGPALLLTAGCGLAALLALVSRGFQATRAIAAVFQIMLFPPANLPLSSIPKHGSDTVFSFTAPVVFALGIAILTVAFRHLRLRGRSWRYWIFLAAKIALSLTLVTLAWIELSALVRSQIPPSTFRILLTGLAFRLVFVGAFVRVSGWCFEDQQRRCPICLLRLAAPVSIGNRSNVFEPAVTEFLCERGHGVLSVPEVEGAEPDRWTAFDSSWSELFETQTR